MKIGSTNVASFRLGEITPSKVYLGTTEVWSDVVATVPGAVTGIDAYTSLTEQAAADITWDEPSNGGSPITGYNIYYSLDSGTTWVAAGTSASSPGVLGPALYLGGEFVKVDVRAVNAIGEGPSADTMDQPMVTLSDSVPSAPTMFTATSVAGYNIYAEWSGPTYDGGQNVTDYEYSYTVNGMESTGSTSGQNNYTVDLNSMNGGQEVQVKVRAYSSVGYGPWSATLTATARDVPSQTNINANSSSSNQGAVTLTIDVPADNYSAITSYDVEYGNDGMNFPASFNYTDQAGSGSFNKEITGLTGGASYYFRVRFRNAVGAADWSPTSNSGASSTPPAQITDLTVTPNYTTNQWDTLWTAPANGGSGITGYEIQEDSSDSFSSPIVRTTSMPPMSFSVDTADSNRYFRVRATNSIGDGQWSPTVTAYYDTPTVPGAPTITASFWDSMQTNIYFNFPADDGNAAITSYTFYFDGVPDTPSSTSLGAGTGTAAFTTDHSGTDATMSATNSVGESPQSDYSPVA